jgi:hypothetical protein
MILKQKIFTGSILLFFLCGFPGLFAQTGAVNQTAPGAEKTTVAVVPFTWTDTQTSSQFVSSLRQAVTDMEAYKPHMVDMNNLPPDVPEGGFPPYVCPSPSMTSNAPYALTGEMTFNEDENTFHLRIWLWEMENVRLIFTDELSAADKEECDMFLPPLLEWIFSWIGGSPLPDAPVQKWIYLGLRAGTSMGFYTRPEASPFAESGANRYFNFEAGVSLAWHFLPFLDLQGEAVFHTDYAPFNSDDPFIAQSMMFPVLLKFSLRKPPLLAAILGGVYFISPLGDMENRTMGGSFGYSYELPLGYTAGVNLGVTAAGHILLLDVRWSEDLRPTIKDTGETLYKRGMLTISVGFELGLFTKK